MATRLSEIKLSEVSLVDTPANKSAQVMLFKRDDKKVDKGLAMKCPSCSVDLPTRYADRGTELPNYCPECGAKMSLSAEGGDVQKNKEKSKMANEFKKESLTPEAKQFVETLEKQVADAAAAEKVLKAEKIELEKKLETAKKTPEPEDIWKGVSPEVRKRVEDSEARAQKAEEIAKSERDARELQMFEKRAETEFSSLPGTAVEKAKVLKAVNQKLSKEEAADVEKLFKSAEEIVKSGKLFGEMGASGSSNLDSDSAEGRLMAKAKDLVSKGVVKTEAEGIEKVAREDDALYQEYRKEVNRRAN